MDEDRQKGERGPGAERGRTAADARAERLAAALRANLSRRKAQDRSRRALARPGPSSAGAEGQGGE